MRRAYQLHNGNFHRSIIDDQQTVSLLSDLFEVMSSLHRGMPVYGPWFEERIKQMLAKIIGKNWCISGPSQLYVNTKPELRSRSWNIIVHKNTEEELPPAASNHSGFPLVPIDLVSTVIDTKTMFGNVSNYASKTISNLRANSAENQLDFLGQKIRKIILAASSNTSQSTLWTNGNNVGLEIYCLTKTKAGPVDQWEDRTWDVSMQYLDNGESPLQAFFNSVSEAVNQFERHQENKENVQKIHKT